MYFLGLDGGGTETRAILTDARGQLLGQGFSGATNPRGNSPEIVRRHLLESIQEACKGIDPKQVRAAHLGIAGMSESKVSSPLRSIVQEFLSAESTYIAIGDDLATALEGGLGGGDGIVLIAGTGSACYGRGPSGPPVQCGGWGDLVDDAGSGAWIGLRSLQLCVRQADGREPESALLAAVMNFLGISSMEDFKSRIHDRGLTREARAKLAPIVLRLAAKGDSAATRLLQEACTELTRLVVAVDRVIRLDECPIVLAGGLNQASGFRQVLVQSLADAGIGGSVIAPRLSAAAGAVLLALKSAHIQIDENLLGALQG